MNTGKMKRDAQLKAVFSPRKRLLSFVHLSPFSIASKTNKVLPVLLMDTPLQYICMVFMMDLSLIEDLSSCRDKSLFGQKNHSSYTPVQAGMRFSMRSSLAGSFPLIFAPMGQIGLLFSYEKGVSIINIDMPICQKGPFCKWKTMSSSNFVIFDYCFQYLILTRLHKSKIHNTQNKRLSQMNGYK